MLSNLPRYKRKLLLGSVPFLVYLLVAQAVSYYMLTVAIDGIPVRTMERVIPCVIWGIMLLAHNWIVLYFHKRWIDSVEP